MQKELFRTILVAALLICIATPLFAADLDELQNKKNEIQEQINQTNEELNIVNEDLTENLRQIEKLDSNIKTNEESIIQMNDEISKIQEEVSKVEKELEEATIVYEKQKQLLDERLVEIYEAGEPNYLEIVFLIKIILFQRILLNL